MTVSTDSNKTLAAQDGSAPTPERQTPPPGGPSVQMIMTALKSAQTAADNGPTWAMVYAGAILILGAFALAGATPVYHPEHSVLLNAAAYVATLIVGSVMIFLAGILRLVNGISVRRDAQAQTNAYYAELANARATRERGQTEDLDAVKQGRENGSPNPPNTGPV